MVLVPYVMFEDKKHPYFNTVYTKLKEPLSSLMERTYKVLQNPILSHSLDLLREYGQYGFIYRGVRYLGLTEPARDPLRILTDEVCPEFPTIHEEYLEILDLKERMFRALRQFEVHLPSSKFMDGESYPEHSPHINFYLKVQEEYLEYIGRFLILRGIE